MSPAGSAAGQKLPAERDIVMISAEGHEDAAEVEASSASLFDSNKSWGKKRGARDGFALFALIFVAYNKPSV